jgi:hypothetical protein
VVLRYCAPGGVERELEIDGSVVAQTRFDGSGGFGSLTQSDWAHQCFRDAKGQRLPIQLTAGEHTVRISNTDGKGMNLDYLALVPAR